MPYSWEGNLRRTGHASGFSGLSTYGLSGLVREIGTHRKGSGCFYLFITSIMLFDVEPGEY